MDKILLTECPRDAMQGWTRFIPTQQKAAYLNQLLKVGFNVLDFGSFVSPKAIPQLADTKEVLPMLNLSDTNTELLAIIANTRGANDAVAFDEISYLGFPFSISETFQLRNTNKTIEESLVQVSEIQNLCAKHGKKMMIYISMGFGNPYGDPYNPEIAMTYVEQLVRLGIENIAMSDTVGVAQPDVITKMFSELIPAFANVKFGAHFHSSATTWEEKVQSAYEAGCLRFDSALRGVGGCPMAEDELVGNLATENLVGWCKQRDIPIGLDNDAFNVAWEMAAQVFVK